MLCAVRTSTVAASATPLPAGFGDLISVFSAVLICCRVRLSAEVRARKHTRILFETGENKKRAWKKAVVLLPWWQKLEPAHSSLCTRTCVRHTRDQDGGTAVVQQQREGIIDPEIVGGCSTLAVYLFLGQTVLPAH